MKFCELWKNCFVFGEMLIRYVFLIFIDVLSLYVCVVYDVIYVFKLIFDIFVIIYFIFYFKEIFLGLSVLKWIWCMFDNLILFEDLDNVIMMIWLYWL